MIILNPALKKRSRKKKLSFAARRARYGRSSGAVGVGVRTRRARRHVGKRRARSRIRVGRDIFNGKYSSSFFARPIASRCGIKRGGWQIRRTRAGKFSSTGGTVSGCFKNPRGLVKSVTAGYQPSAIINALPIALGMILNDKVSAFVGRKTGWESGLKGAAVSVGSAGAALLIPRYGPRLFLGGLARILIDWALPYVSAWTEPVQAPAHVQSAPVSAAPVVPAALPAPALSDAGSRGSGSANPEDAEEFSSSGGAWSPDNSGLPVESSTEDVE